MTMLAAIGTIYRVFAYIGMLLDTSFAMKVYSAEEIQTGRRIVLHGHCVLKTNISRVNTSIAGKEKPGVSVHRKGSVL